MTKQVHEVSKNPKMLDILEKLGWTNGFNSPFANESNRELEKKLEAQQRNILQIRVEVQDITKHLQDLQKHHSTTAEDINFARVFNSCKKLDVEKETTLTSHAERLKKRLEQEVARDEKELMEIRNKNRSWVVMLEKRREHAEYLLDGIDKDAELLLLYNRKVEENKNGIDVVNEYTTMDKSEVRSIEVKQQDLGSANKKLRHDLDQVAVITSKFQEQFDRLSVEFRKLHQEKKDLVKFWQGCLKAMARKDIDMQQMATLYYELKLEIREIEFHYQEQDQLLKNLKESEKEITYSFKQFDSKIAETRGKLNHQRDLVKNYKGDSSHLNLIIRQVALMIQDISKQKEEVLYKADELNGRIVYLESIVNYLKLQKTGILEQKLSQKDYIQELQKMEVQNVKEFNDITSQVSSLQALLRLRFNETKDYEREDHHTETQIIRTTRKVSSITNREVDFTIETSKKKTKMYRLDLEMSNLEIRISRIFTRHIDQRYFKLRTIQKDRQEKHIQLLNDVKLIETEIRKSKHMFRTVVNEIEHLRRNKKWYSDILNEVVLQFQKNTEENASLTSQLKGIRVDHSLKLLNMKHVLKIMQRNRDDLFSSSQRHIAVSSAVKERKSEINYHLTLLNNLHKQLRQGLTKLGVQIQEVETHIGKIKGRYDLTIRLIAFHNQENPTESSFALMILKLAKEREVLIGEKTKWEHRIDESKKELKALQNVLTTVQASNKSFQHSLMPAKPESKEANALSNFESNQKKSMVLRHRYNRVKETLRNKSKDLFNQSLVTKQDVHKNSVNADELVIKLSKIQNEVSRVKSQVNRWDKLINRQAASLIHLSPETVLQIERDIRRRAIAKKYDQAISRLQSLVKENKATQICVMGFLEKQNMLQDYNYKSRMIPGISLSAVSRASRVRRSTGGGGGRKSKDNIHLEEL